MPSPAPRVSPDRPRERRLIIAYWLLIVVIGLSLSPHSLATRALAFGQALLYLPFLILLTRIPTLRALFDGVGRTQRVLFMTMGALILIGQVASDNRKLHPFLQWRMYCSAKPSDTYVEYIAESASGRRDHFPFADAAPTTSPRDFMERFGNKVKSITDVGNLTTSERERLDVFRDEMGTLVRIYNARHHARPNGDPVTRVEVAVRRVPARDWNGKASVERRIVTEIRAE